jgi:hypothetical protein
VPGPGARSVSKTVKHPVGSTGLQFGTDVRKLYEKAMLALSVAQ